VTGDLVHKSDTKELKQAPAGVLLKLAQSARNRAVKPQEGGNQANLLRKRTAEVREPKDKDEDKEVKELTKEEKDRIEQNKDFQTFFERTTVMVERWLGQSTFDVAADFRTASAGGGGGGEEADCMVYVDDYVEERWARSRPITDTRFSPHQKEMFLAAYGQKDHPSLADPDGCLLVWNLAMKARPELTFTCPSAVLTAQFHRFDPALFYGATYSGAIVLWDARAKAGPVLRTPLSGKGHSHPVQAMQQVGTQNATNLVTASNDGRLCVWSLAMLNLPQSTIDLKNETKNRRDLAVMTLSFPENETNTLYVGAEDGSICQVQIHGSKVGVTEAYGPRGPCDGSRHAPPPGRFPAWGRCKL
jgi:dynein intermediate chain